MGRHKSLDPRSEVYTLRATSKELAGWHRVANAHGMQLSSLIRSLLHRESRKLGKPITR